MDVQTNLLVAEGSGDLQLGAHDVELHGERGGTCAAASPCGVSLSDFLGLGRVFTALEGSDARTWALLAPRASLPRCPLPNRAGTTSSTARPAAGDFVQHADLRLWLSTYARRDGPAQVQPTTRTHSPALSVKACPTASSNPRPRGMRTTASARQGREPGTDAHGKFDGDWGANEREGRATVERLTTCRAESPSRRGRALTGSECIAASLPSRCNRSSLRQNFAREWKRGRRPSRSLCRGGQGARGRGTCIS